MEEIIIIITTTELNRAVKKYQINFSYIFIQEQNIKWKLSTTLSTMLYFSITKIDHLSFLRMFCDIITG